MKHAVLFSLIFLSAGMASAQTVTPDDALMALTDVPDFKNPALGWKMLHVFSPKTQDLNLVSYPEFGILLFRLNYSAVMYGNADGTMEAVLIEYPGGSNAAIFAAVNAGNRIFRYAIKTDKWYFAEKLYAENNDETAIDLNGSIDDRKNVLIHVTLKTTGGWKNIEFPVPAPAEDQSAVDVPASKELLPYTEEEKERLARNEALRVLLTLKGVPEFENPDSGWIATGTFMLKESDVRLLNYADNIGSLIFRLRWTAIQYRNADDSMRGVRVAYPGGFQGATVSTMFMGNWTYRFAIKTDAWYLAERLWNKSDPGSSLNPQGSMDENWNIHISITLQTTDGRKTAEFVVPMLLAN